MKKRILFMLAYMNIGGTERSFLNLLQTMSLDEYDVTVLLLEDKGGYMNDIPSRVKIHVLDDYQSIGPEIMDPPLVVARNRLKSGRIMNAFGLTEKHIIYKLTGDRTAYYHYILSAVKSIPGEYDTAVAYAGPMDFITVYILEKVHAKRKIQWIHFDVSQSNFNVKFAKRNYPKFDHVFVVSDAAREQLLKKVPEIASITETRHNIVSREQCLKEAEKGQGFTDEFSGMRILTVGRLSREKGQEIIPEVAYKLKESGYQFRWYLIGSGKTETMIREKIAECHLEDTVILLGTIKNPFPYYAQCDIYVQTSLHEGYCITLAEAQVFDKPIVSTDVAGARDLLHNYPKERITQYNADQLFEEIKEIIDRESV